MLATDTIRLAPPQITLLSRRFAVLDALVQGLRRIVPKHGAQEKATATATATATLQSCIALLHSLIRLRLATLQSLARRSLMRECSSAMQLCDSIKGRKRRRRRLWLWRR